MHVALPCRTTKATSCHDECTTAALEKIVLFISQHQLLTEPHRFNLLHHHHHHCILFRASFTHNNKKLFSSLILHKGASKLRSRTKALFPSINYRSFLSLITSFIQKSNYDTLELYTL